MKTNTRTTLLLIGLSVWAAIPPANSGELLFSQNGDNQSTYGPSLVSASPAQNSEVADDFNIVGAIDRVVAAGFVWGSVDFQGVYVRFYEFGADQKPGALQQEYFFAANDPNVAFNPFSGAIDATLSPAFAATGRHFLSVQPVINYWYWWSAGTGAPRGQPFYFRDNTLGEGWHYGDNLNFNPNADVSFFLYGTATAPATIDSLSTNSLARSGYLEIFGVNFGGSGTVLIGGAPAPVADWTGTRIAVYVPEASPLGQVNLQIVNAGGSSNPRPLNVLARAGDGRVNWRLRMEGAYSLVRPARGPDDTIYAIDVGFRLYAVGPNGNLKWVVRGAGNKGLAVGPDGTIYVASEDFINAYSPDGTARWSFQQAPRAFICLGVTVGPDGNIYSVGTQGMGVFSLTPTGTLRWTNPESYARRIVDYAEIVIGPNNGDQQLYFYANNHTRAVRLADGASVFTLPPTGQPAISPLDGTMHAGAAAFDPRGQLLWTFNPGTPSSVPDLASDGTHYTSVGSTLFALNPNGTEKWRATLIDYIGAPNVDPANTLVVLGSAGTLDSPGFVAAVGTATQTELWRVPLPPEETSVFNPWTGLYGFNQYVDTRAKFSPDGSALYLVTAIATGGLVRDRCFLYSIRAGAGGGPVSPTRPWLQIDRSGVVSWSTNATGFALQSGTVLDGRLVWSDVSQSPEIHGTNFTVTVPFTGASAVYRLWRR